MSLGGLLLRKARSAGTRLRRAAISQRFGFAPSSLYGVDFYEGPACDEGGRYAPSIARILYDETHPTSFFDFGCGRGALLYAMRQLGVPSCGCEGSLHGVRRCPKEVFVFQADLRRPIILNRTFDLVACIEVAEHLPRRSERTLVASIAAASSRHVAFSASGPGMVGDDHINLQPPEHWIELFRTHGFHHRAAFSATVRDELRRLGAPDWYDNMIVLERTQQTRPTDTSSGSS